jgi:hypothetical protein
MSRHKQELEEQLMAWRRGQVVTYLSMGKSQKDIADTLKVDPSVICRDIQFIKKEALEKQSEYIQNLPFEHIKSVASIDKAHLELWRLFESEKDTRQKKAILDSIGDIVIKRQILLGDPQHIDRALKAVAKVRRQIEQQEELQTE